MHRTVARRARPRTPARSRPGTPYRADDPEAAAVDPRRAGRVGDARLPALRPLALARRARTRCGLDYRVVGRALRPARARDAARHRRASSAYMADMYASGDLFVTPTRRASSRSTSSCSRRCRCSSAAGRIGEPDHGRAGCRADIRRQYGFRWDPLRGAALRGGAEYVKRRLPVARPAGRAGDWTASARKFASTTRITPSRTIASQHGDVAPLIAPRIDRGTSRGCCSAYSITATLISSVETLTPVMAAIGGAATGSAWRLTTRLSVQALGARGADVVRLQHLAQRGLGHARDERGRAAARASSHGAHIAFRTASGSSPNGT